MPRALFLIRAKLGDTLAAYASVRGFADAHPEWQSEVMVRADYAPLFEGEAGLRVVPFSSRLGMLSRLAAQRLAGRRYDALAVAWGYGSPLRAVARIVSARRKIHARARYPDLYTESPQLPESFDFYHAAWAAVRMVSDFPKPVALSVPALAARHAAAARPVPAVGIAPLTDEARKNLDAEALRALLGVLAARHPGASLRVFVNPRDPGAASILRAGIEGAEFRQFRSIPELIAEFLQLSAWYGADTGTFHVAAAMGMPATVFFGPTQPWKVVLPGQRNAQPVRIAGLGGAHCDVKDCAHAQCVQHAVKLWAGVPTALDLEKAPANCLIRLKDRTTLDAVAVGAAALAPRT